MASTKTIRTDCGPRCRCAQQAEAEISRQEAGPTVMLPKRRMSLKDRVKPCEDILSEIYNIAKLDDLDGCGPKDDKRLQRSKSSGTAADAESDSGLDDRNTTLNKHRSDPELIRKIMRCEICEARPAGADVDQSLYILTDDKYASLDLPVDCVWEGMKLSDTLALPQKTVLFDLEREPTAEEAEEFMRERSHNRTANINYHPPPYSKPHPPYSPWPARVLGARELTKPGAYKKTFHLDIDVSQYPIEGGVSWVLGGSFGIVTPNSWFWVNPLLERLGISSYEADRTVFMHTTGGRWPTVWDDEKPRDMWVTRRDLLKWSSDFMSQPPSKQLLRMLAEHCNDEKEKTVLLFLCSKEGSEEYCKLKNRCITLLQLLSIFESSQPPLDLLLSVLPPLMARWYSIANDPDQRAGVLEFAFTVNKIPDWKRGERHGVGTTYLEDLCKTYLQRQRSGEQFDETLPIFRGLQMNPFTRKYTSDTPMILIGAGVGIAPFRGFVQRRVQQSGCAGKVWIIQGCRDQTLDDLYRDEWGVGSICNIEDRKDENCCPTPPTIIKPKEIQDNKLSPFRYLAESQAGRCEYVQDEIQQQSALIWKVITSPKGQVYVCGAGNGFCDGVEQALIESVAKEGRLSIDQSRQMWKDWQDPKVLKYVKEVW